MRRSNATADEDARALIQQLREETAHSLNLERTLRDLPPETRQALHTLTKTARAARCGSKTLGELLDR